MKAFKIGMVMVLSGASAFAMDQNELIEAVAAQNKGIEITDVRRGLMAISSQAGKVLKKSCSVYVQGLASIKGGGDCDDGDSDVRPGRRNGEPDFVDMDSDDDGIELVMGNPLHDDDGDISNNPLYEGMAARYADNMFGDFIPQAAEAQDYNAARSNKPTSRSARGDYNSSRSNKYSSRAAIIGASAGVMERYSEDLMRIYTGEDSGANFLESISDEMESLKLDQRYARSIYGDFIKSLQQVYKNENETLKTANINQSEDIYEKASRKTALTIETLKKIIRTASFITQKQIALGDTVEMIGFGSFSISKRSARTGRNPQTGKEIKIGAAPSVVRVRKRPGRTKYSDITLKK